MSTSWAQIERPAPKNQRWGRETIIQRLEIAARRTGSLSEPLPIRQPRDLTQEDRAYPRGARGTSRTPLRVAYSTCREKCPQKMPLGNYTRWPLRAGRANNTVAGLSASRPRRGSFSLSLSEYARAGTRTFPPWITPATNEQRAKTPEFGATNPAAPDPKYSGTRQGGK